MPDINGIPYVDADDLVSAYPAVSQSLAQEVSDQLASKWNAEIADTAPTSPAEGDVWVDTTGATTIPKLWNGSAWVTFSTGAADFSNAATGTYTDTGVDYKYITYNASGTITFTKAGLATFLVVGGGGGGYAAYGAGGGGGVYQIEMPVEATTYSVAIGAGGAINTNRGMGGQSYVGADFNAAIARVSGGPSNWSNLEGAPSGNGYTTVAVASGAGAGGNATDNAIGGQGLASSITGSSVTYGTGGAVVVPVTKTANTGDGGDASAGAASAGASGVVIVRVRTN